jgi:hypothetical protein
MVTPLHDALIGEGPVLFADLLLYYFFRLVLQILSSLIYIKVEKNVSLFIFIVQLPISTLQLAYAYQASPIRHLHVLHRHAARSMVTSLKDATVERCVLRAMRRVVESG